MQVLPWVGIRHLGEVLDEVQEYIQDEVPEDVPSWIDNDSVGSHVSYTRKSKNTSDISNITTCQDLPSSWVLILENVPIIMKNWTFI